MDLVTRLLLETGQFDSNLQKSTSQVRQFQNAGKSFMSAIGGLAAGFGLAMGASEAFKKTIASTQTTSDAFARVTEQGTSALDTFFTSLAKGDFTNFSKNMASSIKQAGALADALDLLEQKNLFNNAEINSLQTQRQIQMNIAKDRTKSDKERLAAQKEVERIDEQMFKRREDLAATNKTVYYRGVRNEVAKQGFDPSLVSNGMVDTALKGSNQVEKDAAVERYNAKVQALKKVIDDHTTVVTSGVGMMASTSREIDETGMKAQKELADYKRTNIDAYYKAISEIGEDQLQIYVDKRNEANSQMIANSTAILERNLAKAKIEGSYNTKHGISTKDKILEVGDEGYNPEEMGASAKKKALIVKGSLDEVNKQIAETRAQYDAAATDQLRTELFKVVSDLEAKKIKLEFVAEHGGSEKGVATPLEMGKIKQAKIEAPDFSGIKPVQITKKDVAVTYDYADGLNAVSNMMGSITNMTRDGASAWISWGATVLGAAASAIPAILAVTAAKKLEAQANITAAGTGAISSAAQTPLIGWLLVGAAAASVIAALASIPKFATGGIVGGSSYTGDKILAGLNSGEMVLNKNQQGNLFKQLNEGGNGGTTVKLRVSGTDLVGVLNNYSSKTKRLR